MTIPRKRPARILLVEDDPGDRLLTQKALRAGRPELELHCVSDGEEALRFLRRQGEFAAAPAPDLMLLDLNLPRKDGREVLAEVRADPTLRRLPVVVLSTSRSESDVLESYDLRANCFITKPIDLDDYCTALATLEAFWFSVATLPSGAPA